MDSITVLQRYKPAQAVATATARLQTREPLPYDAVLDAGLAALNETRTSLYGFGVKGVERPDPDDPSGPELPAGTYTVYAHRD